MISVDEAIASLIPRFSEYYSALMQFYEDSDQLFGTPGDETQRPIFYMGEESDLNKAIDTLSTEEFWTESSRSASPCFPFSSFFMLLRHDHLDSWSAIYVRTGWSQGSFLINLLCMQYNRSRWFPFLFLIFTREQKENLQYGWLLRQALEFQLDSDAKGLTLFDRSNSLVSTFDVVNGLPLSHWVYYFGKKVNQMCILIAHPSNYIVKETPTLTPHEARRVEQGKRFPDAKRPRYIIVDHDVLVGKYRPQGTHASPVPHQRRGHWMRLAERCKHAKAQGIDKTWVRDCNIGETDFVRGGRRYEVLLDFQSKMKQGT